MNNSKFCIGYVNSYYRLAIRDERFSTANAFKEELATNNLEICYRLEQPVTIQFTKEEARVITSLFGINNIWADIGDVNVIYRADTQMFINARDKAITQSIAPIENGETASNAYVQGGYFFHNTKFCKALTAIASGATFTLNTNYAETTVAKELATILNV